MSQTSSLSIILPAKNEAQTLMDLLSELKARHSEAELIVVDDGSSDDTVDICTNLNVKVVSHPYSKGNGAAIKTGARYASGDVLVFLDADGQHNPADIALLLAKIEEGFDMAVGARSFASQASLGRGLGNTIYNKLASWMVNHRIRDLTSGFRAVRATKFRQFLYLLPNGFSYPTTCTMAFFRAGYSVSYVSVDVSRRKGKSHINILRDGVRFLLIIFKIGTLYSPLKLFVPISSGFFVTGVGYYLYTFSVSGRFTNMSALLLTTAVLVFLIGLVSEQITALIYKDHQQ